MTDSRLQNSLLGVLCLLVTILLLRVDPVAQAGQLEPAVESSEAIAQRLDLILAELRDGSSGRETLSTASSGEPMREKVDAGKLAPLLASLEQRIEDLVARAQQRPLSRRLTPKPKSRVQHHRPWMEFKRRLQGGRMSSRMSATFNFMNAEEVLAAFGPPMYIMSVDGGQRWVYERTGSKSSDDDYEFFLQFNGGYVIRVLGG